MTNKSKNADDSLDHGDDEDVTEPRIKHTRYKLEIQEEDKDEDDTFQDEGFLDSYDLDKNGSTPNGST